MRASASTPPSAGLYGNFMEAIKLPISKPPPPPPKFKGGLKVLPHSAAGASEFKQLERYKLPMRGAEPAWRAILLDCGYPTDVVVLDFETYFDAEFKMGPGGLSTIEYVMDPRFEVLGLAGLLVNGPYPDYERLAKLYAGVEMVKTYLGCLQKTYGEHLERATVVIQNATFDATILARHYGIYPPHVVDTRCLASAWNARDKHGLDTLAKDLGLPPKGDTDEFKGCTFRRRFDRPKSRKKGPRLPFQVPMITAEQAARLCGYAANDAMREWEVFTILLPRLSRPKTELYLMQHTLELFTKPTLKVDFEKGEELARLMDAEIDKAVQPTGLSREDTSGDIAFERALTQALEVADDDPQRYWKPCKTGYKLAEAKTDPERELLLNHSNDNVRQLMEARVAINSWPAHIKRVRKIMAQAKASGGLLCMPLKYYGAHTGRWSGEEKINPQNLGSKSEELVNQVREMLVAPAGLRLAIADASQIEARGLAWIAGQDDLVTKFANNEEIYCGFASKVLGWPVRKPRKGGIPAIEARMKWGRNAIGKIGVLGCGYGMGQDRIFALGKGEFDMETALKIRDTYRAENTAIVRFWYDIERAFLYTAKFRKPCEMPRGLRFHSTPGCDVILTLPSGREIHYHRVKIGVSERGEYLDVWNFMEQHWEHTWGGALTENVVQAMCRDILGEAIIRLDLRGCRIAMHVHDEIVMVCPADQAEDTLACGIEELSRRPAWAPDCPLSAEGIVAERYGGH